MRMPATAGLAAVSSRSSRVLIRSRSRCCVGMSASRAHGCAHNDIPSGGVARARRPAHSEGPGGRPGVRVSFDAQHARLTHRAVHASGREELNLGLRPGRADDLPLIYARGAAGIVATATEPRRHGPAFYSGRRYPRCATSRRRRRERRSPQRSRSTRPRRAGWRGGAGS